MIDQQQNFSRLPIGLQKEVREPVWSLGQNAAGLYIDFSTDAPHIDVRYQVSGALNMLHMPSTGVSGVDLYALDTKRHKWEWAFGKYQFTDTISYAFENIGSDEGRVYRLYLPLYNTVKWLEIGVGAAHKFSFVTGQTKSIVVYGTSIAQGACVSRPGMAWTSILGREFSNEVVNLGFSGNGRLEQPILDLIVEEDAAVFILDCLPNLNLKGGRDARQLDSLLRHAVHFIRAKHPAVPIVLSAHSSAFTPGFLNRHTMEEYGESTVVGQETFKKLKQEGVKNIYWLSNEEIGLDINSTVDYAHPNDYGMIKIAEAYRDLLQSIL